MGKTALVVSGGGSKGAFAVGVIKYIQANLPAIKFDTFCGTSTGSLIVPLVAMGEMDLLEKLYTTKKTEDIILTGNVINRFINNNSLFNVSPLAQQITDIYTDARFNKLVKSKKEVFITAVCLQTGRITYFTTTGMPAVNTDYDVVKMKDGQTLREAVLASSCQPVFLPPIEVQAVPEKPRQFVDGGLREYAPIQLAIDNGATDIYAILLTPATPPENNISFRHVMEILQQTIDWFTNDVGVNDVQLPLVYNRALEYINAVKDKMKKAGIPQVDIDHYFDIPFANPFMGKVPLNIHIIRPEKPLGGGAGGLEFDPATMQAMVATGEARAAAYFNTQ